MWRGFEASLTFESDYSEMDGEDEGWYSERKVKVQKRDCDEGELKDSCCFSTRTVEAVETVDFGLDCVWRLHGGV